MQALLNPVVDNPILLRELRRRMRGKALIYGILTYITLMTLSTVLVLLFYSPSPTAEANVELLGELRATGLNVFYWVTGIQCMLVLLVAPTVTAGLTTGEKERQTFDFLRVTTITRWMYILGSFLSTAFYVGLALLCALPLLSITFLYGGVSLGDVLGTFLFLMGGSWVLSAFGLLMSSVFEKTRTAQGVIVFMIFATLFGGIYLWGEYQRFFAGRAAAAGGGGAAQLFVFNVALPAQAVFFGILVAMTWLFLLLAARKLFEPEETRAFAHWQFFGIMAAILGGLLGLLAGNRFTTEMAEILFLGVGYVMLLVAALSFAPGTLEVGDEIWHIKRLFPALRPLDQTLPFLMLVGGMWWLFAGALPGTSLTGLLPAGLAADFPLLSLAFFGFLVALARAVTGATGSRRRAFMVAGLTALVLNGVVPVLVGACWSVLPFLEDTWRPMLAFSPLAMLMDAFRSAPAYGTAGIGLPAAGTYAVLALVTALYGEPKRFLRTRGFNYHYDMPGSA